MPGGCFQTSFTPFAPTLSLLFIYAGALTVKRIEGFLETVGMASFSFCRKIQVSAIRLELSSKSIFEVLFSF